MARTNPTDVIKHPPALELFIAKLAMFEEQFCAFMIDGSDYTLRLEVRGNKREIIHIRCYTDNIWRVAGAQKRVDEKNFAMSSADISE